jgi:malonyl-CoA O-methyltransferase
MLRAGGAIQRPRDARSRAAGPYTAAPVNDPRTDPRHPQAAALAAQLRRSALATAAPWLHAEVARRMAERLALIRTPPARVLDWWAADGGSRALLQARLPQARIDAVEPSTALQARSQRALRTPWWRRLGATPPAVWPEDASPAAGADMVWANMVLHRAADPAATIARWHAALAVDGFLMFSTLGPDTLRELRALYAALGWGAPAQDFVDMHDIGDALVGAGLADPVMDMERLSLSYADAGALLAELRTLGGNAAQARHLALRTPRWRAWLEAELQQRLRGADGRLHLSFELIYGHAFKPLPRVPVAPTATVGVEQLRQLARRGRAAGADGAR